MVYHVVFWINTAWIPKGNTPLTISHCYWGLGKQTDNFKNYYILPLSEIILILYQFLPYITSDDTDASNSWSNNNHDPDHHSPGENHVYDTPFNNHHRCNGCNTDRLFPDDNKNELYMLTTYNLVMCNKLNPDQILTGDEDNGSPNVLYDSDVNNYNHTIYQCMPDNKEDDTHNNVDYHEHDLYPHAPNDNDDNNVRTDVISDDGKANSDKNEYWYDDSISGHHWGSSKDISNTPAVVEDHSEDRALDRHVSSNHGGLNGPSHDDPPFRHQNLH